MIGSNLLQFVLAGALALLLLAVVLLPGMRRRERIDARIRAVSVGVNLRSAGGAPVPAAPTGSLPARALRALGQAVVSSGLLSSKSIEDLGQTMAASGHRTSATLPLFIGAKVALLIGLPLARLAPG